MIFEYVSLELFSYLNFDSYRNWFNFQVFIIKILTKKLIKLVIILIIILITILIIILMIILINIMIILNLSIIVIKKNNKFKYLLEAFIVYLIL